MVNLNYAKKFCTRNKRNLTSRHNELNLGVNWSDFFNVIVETKELRRFPFPHRLKMVTYVEIALLPEKKLLTYLLEPY
jgi:hypothetical protein